MSLAVIVRRYGEYLTTLRHALSGVNYSPGAIAVSGLFPGLDRQE